MLRLATLPAPRGASPLHEALAALERGRVFDRMLNALVAEHGVTHEEAREAISVSVTRALRRHTDQHEAAQ